MRRWAGVLVAIVVLVIAGVIGVLAATNFSDDTVSANDAPPAAPLASTEVVRTDLVSTETLTGLLRYADPDTLFAAGAGTVTALPDGGDILERGDVAYELNGLPVVLLYGQRPAWRVLSEGVDDGPDVTQLETNLVELGFVDGELPVDETYDADTAAAVETWQEALGVEQTGAVTPDLLAFVSGPVRVGGRLAQVGSVIVPGTPIYETSSQQREVLVLLAADDQDLVTRGDTVTVDLPDGSTSPGTVRDVSRVVITDGEGPDAQRVVEVFIDIEAETGDLDEAPVDVEVVSSEAEDVLAVPVEALLALAEGGYALETPEGDLIAVELGTFADGMVEVIGEVAEGDVVLVPR